VTLDFGSYFRDWASLFEISAVHPIWEGPRKGRQTSDTANLSGQFTVAGVLPTSGRPLQDYHQSSFTPQPRSTFPTIAKPHTLGAWYARTLQDTSNRERPERRTDTAYKELARFNIDVCSSSMRNSRSKRSATTLSVFTVVVRSFSFRSQSAWW